MSSSVEPTHETQGGSLEAGVPSSKVRAEIAALTDRGKVRETNEDAFVVYRLGRYLARLASNVPDAELPTQFEEAGYVMIVADGMGGHEAGEVASRSALVSTFRFILQSPRWVLKLDDPATRKADMEEIYAQGREYLATVHAALREQASRDPRLAGMGTTLTGAYSVGVDLFVSHVGDSKAYLVRDGALRKLTRDHTVAQHYADIGIIEQEDVAGHRMHHVLTRAVGGPAEALEGDLDHFRVRNGDRLLLCSDGLTDMASEPEILATLAAHPESEDACRALVQLALDHGGRDNVTVIVAGYTVE